MFRWLRGRLYGDQTGESLFRNIQFVYASCGIPPPRRVAPRPPPRDDSIRLGPFAALFVVQALHATTGCLRGGAEPPLVILSSASARLPTMLVRNPRPASSPPSATSAHVPPATPVAVPLPARRARPPSARSRHPASRSLGAGGGAPAASSGRSRRTRRAGRIRAIGGAA